MYDGNILLLKMQYFDDSNMHTEYDESEMKIQISLIRFMFCKKCHCFFFYHFEWLNMNNASIEVYNVKKS